MPRRKRFQQLPSDHPANDPNLDVGDINEFEKIIIAHPNILENNEVTTTMEMKHLVFGISRSSSDLEGGPKAASNIEKFIKENYFDNGWKLFKMFYMGSDPEYFQFLYVLTREQ